jgi:hypothetical protein
MNTKERVDALFTNYEESAPLRDFKEELKSNLDDRIKSLVRKGLDEKAAFEKAMSELGDVSVIADEISLKKRQEVFENMYMKTRNYMTKKRIALFVLCGAMLGFGVVTSLLSWFYSGDINAPLGVLLIFGAIPVLGFIFLGLTQETAAHEAMSWQRAALYLVASGMFLFGVIVFMMIYFSNGAGLPEAIATLIPFVLPSVAFGVFLVLSEKDRSKPWIIALRNEAVRRESERFVNPAQEERFGLLSGALWISAAAAFVLLTMTMGIKFSWLVFVAAVVGEMIMLSAFSAKRK